MGGVAATLSSGAVGQDAAGLRCHDAARSAACTVLAVAGVAVAVHLRRLHRAGLGSLLDLSGVGQLDAARPRAIGEVADAVDGKREDGAICADDFDADRSAATPCAIAAVWFVRGGVHGARDLEGRRAGHGRVAGDAGLAGIHA